MITMSLGGTCVLRITVISESVRIRPTSINDDVTLLKLLFDRFATFCVPRNTRKLPRKLIRENKINVTSEEVTTLLKRKLDS